MQTKTDELLYMLLWGCEMITRPTFRNLSESFESWAYRKGLLRQLQRLERSQWIEAKKGLSGDRLYRLSEAGRLQAMGGRDPEAWWQRAWDGRWRLVLFDVPELQRRSRHELRQYLKSRGFGFLQNSVWVTPDPMSEERETLAGGLLNVKSLILMEGWPCGGESDSEIVAGAWDFVEINRAYARHRKILGQRPDHPVENESDAEAFYEWLQKERRAWMEAVNRDPLLPQALLPPGYLGRTAWKRRQTEMAAAGKQMREFRFEGDKI